MINNLHQLVEEQAKKTPNAIALLYLDKEMKKVQLNLKINEIINYFHSKTLVSKKSIKVFIDCNFNFFIPIFSGSKTKFLAKNNSDDRNSYII